MAGDETLAHCALPEEHWRRIGTLRSDAFCAGYRRHTRVAGSFPDGRRATSE